MTLNRIEFTPFNPIITPQVPPITPINASVPVESEPRETTVEEILEEFGETSTPVQEEPQPDGEITEPVLSAIAAEEIDREFDDFEEPEGPVEGTEPTPVEESVERREEEEREEESIPTEEREETTAEDINVEFTEEETPAINPVPSDNVNTLRFSSAPWFNEAYDHSVAIYGLGGSGSWTSMAVARLGLNSVNCYDFDTIERGNMAGQCYFLSDVGMTKTSAMGAKLRNFTSDTYIHCDKDKLTEYSSLPSYQNIVIGCFDNMEARKLLFNKWYYRESRMEEGSRNSLFIDTRLSAEQLQIFCFTFKDEAFIADYRDNWLFDDNQADREVCSYKQTTFAGMMLGSLVANLIANFLSNEKAKTDPSIIERPLPYKTFYDAEFMTFNTIE